MSADNSQSRAQHWVKTRNLTFLILALWVIFSMIVPWFAKSLDSITIFGGFTLGYYMIVQGSLIAFVVMIWFQNWRQDAIDDEFGVGDE